MPILKGAQNIRKNIIELTHGKVGKTRAKAIKTIARKQGISTKEAKFKQALAIAYSQAKKK